MKCPFKLPVKRVKSNIGTYYVVENRKGGEREIGFDFSKEQADYIVQAINGYEKLVEVKKELKASDNWLHRLLKSCVIFLDDGEVTKRAVEKQSRYNQQALKESESK